MFTALVRMRFFLLAIVVAVCSLIPANIAAAHPPPPPSQPQGPKLLAFTTAAVNGRSAPEVRDDTLLGTYDAGALLRVVDAGGEWVQVVHDSTTRFPDMPLSGGPVFVDKQYLLFVNPADVAPLQSPLPRRIVVDLSDQHLWAYLGDQLYLESPVSTGREGHENTPGTYHISYKRWNQNMQGYQDDGDRRSTPGVSFVQYFDLKRGTAFHGTYWHDRFGKERMSYCCINLPIPAAQKLFILTNPALTSFDRELIWGTDPNATVIIQE